MNVIHETKFDPRQEVFHVDEERRIRIYMVVEIDIKIKSYTSKTEMVVEYTGQPRGSHHCVRFKEQDLFGTLEEAYKHANR